MTRREGSLSIEDAMPGVGVGVTGETPEPEEKEPGVPYSNPGNQKVFVHSYIHAFIHGHPAKNHPAGPQGSFPSARSSTRFHLPPLNFRKPQRAGVRGPTTSSTAPLTETRSEVRMRASPSFFFPPSSHHRSGRKLKLQGRGFQARALFILIRWVELR